MKLNPKKIDVIKAKVAKKREEIGLLLSDVKSTFKEVER